MSAPRSPAPNEPRPWAPIRHCYRVPNGTPVRIGEPDRPEQILRVQPAIEGGAIFAYVVTTELPPGGCE